MSKVICSAFALLLVCVSSFGQSIYSFQGLGSLQHQGMPNNFGMGEVGIGTPTPFHVNSQNPANLVYNTLSSFQLGIEIDRRKFSGENISGSGINGSLRYLGYAFPIMNGKWSSSFGILPLSTVNYNTFSERFVEGFDDIVQTSDDRGEGGLTNLFWSNGFKIKKKLSLGLRINYTFGAIDKESNITIEEITLDDDGNENRINIASPINYQVNESYSDINFLIGLGYRLSLGESKFLNLGVTYQAESNLNGRSELSLNRLGVSGGELSTQSVGSLAIDQKLPQSIGIGFSYQIPNALTIGLDLETQKWNSTQTVSRTLTNFFKIAAGIMWTPDYNNVNSYFKRARYSFGVSRTKLPYVVKNQSLVGFGINFGVSLPVGAFSSLDLGFKYGQLGKFNDEGLFRESYLKIVVGATINDRWFIKRRYN